MDEASKRNTPFYEQFFNDRKNNHIDWFVIAHKKGNVILKGGNNDEPMHEELGLLAKKINKAIFTYSRPMNYCMETEEIFSVYPD